VGSIPIARFNKPNSLQTFNAATAAPFGCLHHPTESRKTTSQIGDTCGDPNVHSRWQPELACETPDGFGVNWRGVIAPQRISS
jgi:hypothetical protein